MNKEAAGVILACLGLLGLTAASGEWLWTGFVGTLIASLGLFEYIGVKRDGRTLTTRFRELGNTGKTTITGGILGFITWLMYHLWLEG